MAELILSTDDGSIVNTPVSGGLLSEDDGAVTVDAVSLGETVAGASGTLPIYATDGAPLYATDGTPLHAAIVRHIPESDFSGYEVEGEAEITIDWSGAGYDDLDCCAYWVDNPSYKVGWSYGNGSIVDDNFKMWWTADNTGSGPETISLLTSAARRSTKESSPYQYRIHLNFYGEGSGTSTATVYVSFNGTNLSKTITPSTNDGEAASTSDPYVTITFNADGTPTAIN